MDRTVFPVRRRGAPRPLRIAVRLVAPGVALLALCSTRPAVQIDRWWAAPGFRGDSLGEIAILPVVTSSGDAIVAHRVATRWLAHHLGVGSFRLNDMDCLARLGDTARERDSILAVVSREIRVEGRPRPGTSNSLARRLGVSALLALRVDRWEARSGVRDMAYVDLTGALVDSAGRALWTGAGRARVEAEREPAHTLFEQRTTSPGGSHLVVSQSGRSSSSRSSSGSSSGGSSGGSRSSSTSSTSSSSSSSQSGSGVQVTRVADPGQTTTIWLGPLPEVHAPFDAALDTLLQAFSKRLAGRPAAQDRQR
jgi:hypothetical protein